MAEAGPGRGHSTWPLQSYTLIMARPGAGAGLANRGFEGDGTNVAFSPPAAAPPPEAAGAELADCSLLGLRLRPLNILRGPRCCTVLHCTVLYCTVLLRGPRCCLVFLSAAAFVQGLCINGLANVVITTIERRSALTRARQELC